MAKSNSPVIYRGNSAYNIKDEFETRTGTFAATSNQLVLGTTNTTTISATAPSSSITLTIPDAGTNADFILSESAQTINGAKTFSNTITGDISGNAGTVTDGAYLSASQSFTGANTFTQTITGDISGNAGTVTDGAYLSASQSFTGANTFTQTITGDISGNAGTVTNGAYINVTNSFTSAQNILATTNQLVLGTTNTTTISATAPSASRVYTMPDVGGNADFVMTAGAQTIGGAKTFSDDLTVGSTTLFADVSTNQVSIGTTSTVGVLNVAGAPGASVRVLTLDNTTASATDSLIGFRTEGTNRGFIGCNSSGETRFIASNGTTTNMLIDASGNVGIGTASPDAVTHIQGSASGSVLSALKLSNNVNANGSGTALEFADVLDIVTTKIESLRSGSNYSLGFYTTSSSTLSEKMKIAGNGAVTLGPSGAPQTHDIYDALRFPNGGNQAFDYYGGGTWTPILPNGGTLSLTGARYIRVGNLCTATFYVTSISPTANTSEFRISLPFTSSNNTTSYYWGGNISFSSSVDSSYIRPLVRENTSFVYFHEVDGTNASTITNNGWIAIGITSIIITVTYETA